MENLKAHWDSIYSTKQSTQLSWWQDIPKTSLKLIHTLGLPKSSRIIDIGGGDSMLVDYLLREGYQHISVLDISAIALGRAKDRLGASADAVEWIATDIRDFHPSSGYDLWHDRAMFHFLTEDEQTSAYHAVLRESINKNGFVIIGTFSTNGPKRCSGLATQQYDREKLKLTLGNDFQEIRSLTIDHTTPGGVIQNFQFCCLQKIPILK